MSPIAVIDKYVARLLMLSFFLPNALQVFGVGVCSVYFVVRTVMDHYIVPIGNLGWSLLLSCSYILYLLYIPYTPYQFREELITICTHRISFILLPFAYAIISPPFLRLIQKQLLFFVYGCILLCLYGNLFFLVHYLQAAHHQLSHVEYRMYFEAVTGFHPTYISVYLCLAVCILLLYQPSESMGRYVKQVLLGASLLFLLSLLAKAPIIALVIILAHYFYTRRSFLKQQRNLLITLFISVALVCLFVPFVSQRVGEMFRFAGHTANENVIDNSVYMRQLIWRTDISLLKDNWLNGVGPGRLQPLLNEQYHIYSQAHSTDIGTYDPHNEYLSQWLSFGLWGIILMANILIAHCSTAIRSKNNLYLYLMIILAVTFFTETFLNRQSGIIFYALFTSLLFFLNSSPEADYSEELN